MRKSPIETVGSGRETAGSRPSGPESEPESAENRKIPDEVSAPPGDTVTRPDGEPPGNPAVSPTGKEDGYKTVPII